MDNRLNGTGWGEIKKEQELKIPEFMLSDYRTVNLAVPVSAYRAQGMGRAKRQVRNEKRIRRNLRNGLVYSAAAFGVLVIAINIMEILL